MATALLRVILSQGDALDRMAGLDLAEPAGVLAGATRIILVGTGTSQHAAELGAMMLDGADRDARWYPAATWARWSISAACWSTVLSGTKRMLGRLTASQQASASTLSFLRPHLT